MYTMMVYKTKFLLWPSWFVFHLFWHILNKEYNYSWWLLLLVYTQGHWKKNYIQYYEKNELILIRSFFFSIPIINWLAEFVSKCICINITDFQLNFCLCSKRYSLVYVTCNKLLMLMYITYPKFFTNSYDSQCIKPEE